MTTGDLLIQGFGIINVQHFKLVVIYFHLNTKEQIAFKSYLGISAEEILVLGCTDITSNQYKSRPIQCINQMGDAIFLLEQQREIYRVGCSLC